MYRSVWLSDRVCVKDASSHGRGSCKTLERGDGVFVAAAGGRVALSKWDGGVNQLDSGTIEFNTTQGKEKMRVGITTLKDQQYAPTIEFKYTSREVAALVWCPRRPPAIL